MRLSWARSRSVRGNSVNGYAARLAIGSISRLFRNATLLHVHPERANLGRFFCSQMVAGNIEGAPISIKPVAGHELPQRHHVAAVEVEGPWAGSAGKSTLSRGRDAAFINAIARQEPFDTQDGERVCRLVASENRVDEFIAPPQKLFFFPFQTTACPSSVQVGTG